jgi:hypothetical protein
VRDRPRLLRKALQQGLAIHPLEVRDAKLKAWQVDDVVRVGTWHEAQGIIGQPGEQAPELALRPRLRSYAADVMDARREDPILSLEGLRQPACHAVLLQHQDLALALGQRARRGQAADARSDDDGIPHPCPLVRDCRDHNSR